MTLASSLAALSRRLRSTHHGSEGRVEVLSTLDDFLVDHEDQIRTKVLQPRPVLVAACYASQTKQEATDSSATPPSQARQDAVTPGAVRVRDEGAAYGTIQPRGANQITCPSISPYPGLSHPPRTSSPLPQILKAMRIIDSIANHSDLLDDIMAFGQFVHALPRLLAAHERAAEQVHLISPPSITDEGRVAPMTDEQQACFGVATMANVILGKLAQTSTERQRTLGAIDGLWSALAGAIRSLKLRAVVHVLNVRLRLRVRAACEA
jgi:hypothetical protein